MSLKQRVIEHIKDMWQLLILIGKAGKLVGKIFLMTLAILLVIVTVLIPEEIMGRYRLWKTKRNTNV